MWQEKCAGKYQETSVMRRQKEHLKMWQETRRQEKQRWEICTTDTGPGVETDRLTLLIKIGIIIKCLWDSDPEFDMTNGSIVGKVACETRFSLWFGSQRRKSAPETRFLWPFMLNMMGNKENRVWRGYFCRTDPFGKDAGTKIRTESQIKPGKRKGKWIDYKENQIVPGNRLWSQIWIKSQDAKRNRSENSRKHKTIKNGTARSGETTNKQKSVDVEEE